MKIGELIYNENNNLIYEETSITDMSTQIPINVILNGLGKEDTIITLIVIAEDRSNYKRV